MRSSRALVTWRGFHSSSVVGREKIVILGSGWGGYEAALSLDTKQNNVTLISPANHKVFTPMLPSTATGYLDFQSVTEPVRNIPGLKYHQAKARNIDFEAKSILCEDIFKHRTFEENYDKLIIAVGCKTNTFDTPGIADNEGHCVFFLKHIHHAAQIKGRILECFERADIPGTTVDEVERLLRFIVVGGGPTSCEFAADLHDFVTNDITRLYPDLVPHFKLSLVEAGGALLGSFDTALRDYALSSLTKRKIDVRLGVSVKAVVTETAKHAENARHTSPFAIAELSDGTALPFGCLVWSAGLAPVKLMTTLQGKGLASHGSGRILVDGKQQVLGHEGVIWAVGDCAICPDHPLPPIAPAAQQQGQYVASILNGMPAQGDFKLFMMGSMANLGIGQGLYETPELPGGNKVTISGPVAWIMWKGGYWGLRQVSWRNRLLIPIQWLKTWIFGRDISRFY